MEKTYIVVTDGLAKDKCGSTLPEPSFVYRQVLDYLLKILHEASVVYLAPANQFNGELYEQEAAYNYLKGLTQCRNIYFPVYNGYGYIDTFGNGYLLKKYLIKINKWPLHAVDLVCAKIHSYRAEYCFRKLGYKIKQVHRVEYRTNLNEDIVERLWYYRFKSIHLFYEICAMTREIIRNAMEYIWPRIW